jgi:hypothetical protein
MSLLGTVTMTATELVEREMLDVPTASQTARRAGRAPRQRFKPREGLRGDEHEDALVIAHLASSGMVETKLLGPRIRARAAVLCSPCADDDPWCQGCLIVEPEYAEGHGPYRLRG